MAAARGRPSGPRPAVLLEQVRREALAGWPPGLTVLTGDDTYHLDAAQKALLVALVPADASDFGLSVFGEQQIDLSHVLGTARSAGMFSPRRVVLVREVSALDGDPEPLVDYAERPPPESFLLVRAPKLDLRRKLHQALRKSGRVLEFVQADPAGAAVDVTALAARKGLKIERQAAVFLAEVCAGDFQRMDGELEKIRCWLGAAEGAIVDLARVQETVAGSGLLSGWEVANAVLERDRPAALAALRRLLQAGSEPLQLVGGLAYRARAMLRAKLLLGAGAPADRAFREAGLWDRSLGTAAMAQGLARYSTADLLRFPSLLLDADRTLKSRSLKPSAVLETLLEELTVERSS